MLGQFPQIEEKRRHQQSTKARVLKRDVFVGELAHFCNTTALSLPTWLLGGLAGCAAFQHNAHSLGVCCLQEHVNQSLAIDIDEVLTLVFDTCWEQVADHLHFMHNLLLKHNVGTEICIYNHFNQSLEEVPLPPLTYLCLVALQEASHFFHHRLTYFTHGKSFLLNYGFLSTQKNPTRQYIST